MASSFTRRLSEGGRSEATSRRLKRHKSAGGPPIVQHKICIGDLAVPCNIETVDDRATYVVSIATRRSSSSNMKWLFAPLGVACLPSTCVIEEICNEIAQVRPDRLKGMWKGKDGAMVLSATIRGQQLRFFNDKKQIRMLFDQVQQEPDGPTTFPQLQWLVNELYKDIHAAPEWARGGSDSSGEDEDDVSCMDEDGDGDADQGGDDHDRKLQQRIESFKMKEDFSMAWAAAARNELRL